ncbi:MAG: DinB family protein [Candidatus Sulfotelmatobacter sp.]
MDIPFISELYSYNRWANAKTLVVASRLDNEAFTRELGNSFSSVRDTLVHILGAEWIWLERWNGRSPKALPSSAELPTLAAITARWKQMEAEQNSFLQRLRASDLSAVLSYVNPRGETWSYPLGQQMLHVLNHSSYHRGQITTLLRQLGAEPVSTDLLLYYDEQQAPSP